MSHTYAILPVSKTVWDEVTSKLRDAGYDHAIDGDLVDMQGIALQSTSDTAAPKSATLRTTTESDEHRTS